ncbi:hypothetical protein QIF44_14305 [Stenotrophomonas indicatrix]|uniref:hypothetical protein n=1 Tax=Stenotrophomonas indicatrix TaxID=2045451 RepID=UPI00249AA667|nr:hypothetical protein [Stenotrophomonas indicatrix]WGV53478.1 hypothetical protein QIF44_14305 [Stenotrophomonas indicatrix]
MVMFPFIQSKNKEGAVTKGVEHSVTRVAAEDGRDLNPTPKGFRCSSTCIPRATKAKVPAARQESGGTFHLHSPRNESEGAGSTTRIWRNILLYH